MKKLLLVSFILLFEGCSIFKGNKNSKYAYYTFSNDVYQIELLGKRANMVHDPVSILNNDRHNTQILFVVPKINGVIKGEKILSPKNYDSKYVGEIRINANRMRINLEYDYFDKESANHPVSWNGEYILMKKSSI